MDKKSIAEIRKLMTKEHCRIDRIRGVFVNEEREIVTRLEEPFLAMPEELAEKYCEIFRKVLTGKKGKNLFSAQFPLQEVMQGSRQERLYRLLNSELKDEKLLRDFFQELIDTLELPGKYLLLLAHGVYDIPTVTSDLQELEDASDTVYLFLVGCVCPVTLIQEGLCYDRENESFTNKNGDLGVQMPALGFLYPAFEERMPDVNSLLYYSRKEEERHPELLDCLVGSELPITESDQKELFTDVVEQTLGRSCVFDNVKSLTESVNQLIQENEEEPEALELGKNQLLRVMKESGVPGEALESFEEVYRETVGEGNSFTAENIGGRSTMEIKSPSIRISVKSDMTQMITTRILDGREYLLIPVQDEIEVNGIRIVSKVGMQEDRQEEADEI